MDKREGLVVALPHLGTGAAMLGSEVMQCVVGKETDQMLVQSMAKICRRYTCSLSKTVTNRRMR